MRSRHTLALLAVLLVTAPVTPAAAQTVAHDNGPPDGVENFEMTQFHLADDFTLAEAWVLSSVRFWTAAPEGAYQGAVAWTVFGDGGGRPGSALHTGIGSPTRTFLGLSPNPLFRRHQNDLDIGAVALGPGTYWLGLHNGPLGTTTFMSFLWLTAASNATLPTLADRLDVPAVEWEASPGQYQAAWSISGTVVSTVPEPGTWATLGTGLLVVGAWGVRGARRREASGAG